MKRNLLVVALVLFIASACTQKTTDKQGSEYQHFDPKGKGPSEFTIAKWEALKNSLPFDDKLDFEEQKRGFIAAPDYTQILGDDGHVVWDIVGQYDFLLEGEEFHSIHPSLQRLATLNMNYGLYEVTSGIYQVRGFDLSNITFVEGETGWIVFDPLTAKETAEAALHFVNEQLGERPVVAVVYSHPHADHFAGVRGVVDEEDVINGKVQIIAPDEFMHHAVSENVYAGNAMIRRMYYQYGSMLARDPHGHVDQSIGKYSPLGTLGLIAPTIEIKEDIEELTVDGVRMIFHNTPGTEAPAEMNTYFPDKKAFWAAENITATIHNIYTLRGALVRDPMEWSKQINKALYLFGQEAEVMFASHSWPRWGNERIQEVMKGQRDAYAHLNNGVLHLANQGVTINEIQNVYEVPKSLQNQWYARSYHGSVEHNSRAVINRYLGYWDANPATLIPLSPGESAPLYVEMMGGAKPILKKGQQLHDNGEYMLAVEILNKLVYAEPENTKAKELLADCYEQIGYQQESPSVRNSFLNGAFELRNGILDLPFKGATSPDVIKALTTGMWLDNLAILLDSKKVEDLEFTMNLVTPDNNEKYIVELSNATLTNIEGFLADDADLSITINRTDLDLVMMGMKSLAEMVNDGTAKLEGNAEVLEQAAQALTVFKQEFEILPGTTLVD